MLLFWLIYLKNCYVTNRNIKYNQSDTVEAFEGRHVQASGDTCFFILSPPTGIGRTSDHLMRDSFVIKLLSIMWMTVSKLENTTSNMYTVFLWRKVTVVRSLLSGTQGSPATVHLRRNIITSKPCLASTQPWGKLCSMNVGRKTNLLYMVPSSGPQHSYSV